MKKLLIFLLIAALLGGGGYFGLREYKKSKDEKTVVDVVPVQMMAERMDMFSYGGGEMNGQISAANVQKVYVDSDKLVQNVLVERGQTVKKGDVILEYDMTVVELELAQKENNAAVAEQDIKMAKKKLAEIKTYKPSEEMPQPDHPDEPDYPDEPDFPDEPEEPEEPEIPLTAVTEVTPATAPVSGNGSAEDPLVFNCYSTAEVRKAFMLSLASGNRTAELRVYSPDSVFLYKWILSGGQINPLETEDWSVTEGLLVDESNYSVSVAGGAPLRGLLSFAPPVKEEEEFPELPEEPEEYMEPEIPADFPEIPEDSNDYRYTRREIQKMISEQENEIKRLELELKSAQMAAETARKQKTDGKVVAELDGVVKKIGRASGDEGPAPDAEGSDEFFGFKKEVGYDEQDDDSFAIIEGEGGAEVICTVSELNLPKVPEGTLLNVMSYMNGAFTQAEVTGVESEPASYNAQNWGDNPLNSSYNLHARLLDDADFTVGTWVSVTMENQSGTDSGNSVCLPIHYVRREGGDYYILKAGEDGRLVKQYVRAGQVLYGYYIEISGGLDMSDKIAFPYGPNAKEGVRTNETETVLLPENY